MMKANLNIGENTIIIVQIVGKLKKRITYLENIPINILKG